MNTPILNALRKYKDSNTVPFHVPGHKMGNIFKKLNIKFDDLIELDTTEVEGIDNLHAPETSIKEAEELAAKVFGADQTFFLINGTTCGIYAMILGVTEAGDSIIIPRNCHKSVTGAMILGRLKPIYIIPEIDDVLNISCAITPIQVEEALKQNPQAKAVVITNPTYYGTCSDIKSIADIVHSYGKLLLVDEAHGAHFAFHEKLPISALKAGADIVTQSTHKTLASLTGSSMCHVKSNKVDTAKLRFFLKLMQTTSPSHIMLASLDIARYIMESSGQELLNDIINMCNITRIEINKIDGIYCMNIERIGSNGIHEIDITRIVINFSGLNISGTEADKWLREKHNIQVELSDSQNIVAVSTIGDQWEYFERLIKALKELAKVYRASNKNMSNDKAYLRADSIPEMAMLPYEAIYKSTEILELKASIGRICGEIIIPYPPGIPLIMPGEIINEEVLKNINTCLINHIKINGISDNTMRTIKVVNNKKGKGNIL